MIRTIGSPEETIFGVKEDIQYSPANCKLAKITIDDKSGSLTFYYTSFSKIPQEDFMVDYSYEPSQPPETMTYFEWMYGPELGKYVQEKLTY